MTDSSDRVSGAAAAGAAGLAVPARPAAGTLLERCDRLLAAVDRLYRCAQRGDWDAVVALGSDIGEIATAVRGHPDSGNVDPAVRNDCVERLQRSLVLVGQTSSLAAARMNDELLPKMEVLRQRKQLHETYDQVAAQTVLRAPERGRRS